MRLTRLFLALALASAVAGCGKTRPCRPGTLLVEVTLDGSAGDADSFDVTATIDGASTSATVTRTSTRAMGALQLEFPPGTPYPVGKSLTLMITAKQNGQPVGQGSLGPLTIAAGCASLAVEIGASSSSDGGGSDAGNDACHDGVKDGTESDIDCGGSCSPCGDGLGCASGADCSSTVCNQISSLCVASRCLDGVRNDAETAIDCGGGTCPACGDGLGCSGNSDCSSTFCNTTAGVCVTAQCLDGVTDGSETAADCGGSCPGCAVGQTCGVHADCVSAYCSGTTCANCSPQLLALEPAVATAGATVTLEGVFCGNATVNFPGGLTATATLLGANRATVTVPSPAAAGSLSVTVGPNSSAALPFRGASFGLGLSQFSMQYEQADGARLMPSLVAGRYGHTSTVIGNYVYIVGGYGNTGVLGTVERATLNADGTVGAFSTVAGVTLVTPRYYHTSVVVGSYLYVIGGVGNSGLIGGVERAAISADGTISTFATVATVNLVDPRYAHGVVVLGSSLYVVGGESMNGPDGTVEQATIDAGGNLSTFATVAGVTLATPRYGHGLIVVGNNLYVVGGLSGSYLNTVESAAIGADGTLSTFTTVAGVNLLNPRAMHVTAVLGNAVYVIAGFNGSYLQDVEKATINPDGSLTTFASATGLQLYYARENAGSFVAGNYLYVAGGYNGSNQATLERAPINADGTLANLATVSGSALVTARYGHTSVVLGNHLYVIGGFGTDYLGSVEQATINPDGSLSAFTTVAGVSLLTPRAYHTTAVLGGYLYVIGGFNGGYLGDIEQATINADGSLSAFTESSVSLTTPRQNHTTVAIGTVLWVIGGSNSGGKLQSIEEAGISPDGTLSGFGFDANLITARDGHVSAVLGNGYFYAFGGFTTAAQTNIELAQTDPSGDMDSSFAISGTTHLVNGRTQHSGAVVGNRIYMLGGIKTTAALTSIERATINTDGTTSTFATVAGVTLATARQDHSSVIIGNQLYVIGGLGASALSSVERALLP